MAQVLYTNAGALALAAAVQDGLALSKLQLFKTGVALGAQTTKEQLDAAEADFDGYTTGGVTITAWLDPLLDPNGGASIESGTQQFNWVHDTDDVENLIAGWYLVDADGKLRAAGSFDEAITMAGPFQGIPLNVKLQFPAS